MHLNFCLALGLLSATTSGVIAAPVEATASVGASNVTPAEDVIAALKSLTNMTVSLTNATKGSVNSTAGKAFDPLTHALTNSTQTIKTKGVFASNVTAAQLAEAYQNFTKAGALLTKDFGSASNSTNSALKAVEAAFESFDEKLKVAFPGINFNASLPNAGQFHGNFSNNGSGLIIPKPKTNITVLPSAPKFTLSLPKESLPTINPSFKPISIPSVTFPAIGKSTTTTKAPTTTSVPATTTSKTSPTSTGPTATSTAKPTSPIDTLINLFKKIGF